MDIETVKAADKVRKFMKRTKLDNDFYAFLVKKGTTIDDIVKSIRR